MTAAQTLLLLQANSQAGSSWQLNPGNFSLGTGPEGAVTLASAWYPQGRGVSTFIRINSD